MGRLATLFGLPPLIFLILLVTMYFVPSVFFMLEAHAATNPSLLFSLIQFIGAYIHCPGGVGLRVCPILGYERMYGYGGAGMALHPVTPGLTAAEGQSWILKRFTSAAVKESAYNPKLKRSKDILLLANVSMIPLYIREQALPGIWPTVFSLDTDNSNRTAIRKVWADSLPALLEKYEEEPKFRAPDGVSKMDFRDFDARDLTIALNYFRRIFGTDVRGNWDPEELLTIRDEISRFISLTGYYEDTLMGSIRNIRFGSATDYVEKFALMRERFESRIFGTKVGKQLIENAEKQGMDGQAVLRHFLFGLFYVGMAATPDTVTEIMKMIDTDPKTHIRLFKSDPEAYILEACRVHVAVPGMLHIVPGVEHVKLGSKADTEFSMVSSGATFEKPDGDFSSTENAGHNLDPSVFGGGRRNFEFAKKFLPGRANSGRLMTFNAELIDVKKCKDAAGCVEAPRPCPAIHLALRTIKDVVGFFIAGFEEELRIKGEITGEL
eukprot:TRINITY_DN32186_c0_g2_i1.p1 TRINITY_DN32186_c0_g2~~TRINITY_DN32186_c0_g2_i1.p1  ORF type:complete len:494 (+),score=68.74 TRINITY_DN32186_c0_g2_i1:108-1589(+)